MSDVLEARLVIERAKLNRLQARKTSDQNRQEIDQRIELLESKRSWILEDGEEYDAKIADSIKRTKTKIETLEGKLAAAQVAEENRSGP